jgi:hypothetical protein
VTGGWRERWRHAGGLVDVGEGEEGGGSLKEDEGRSVPRAPAAEVRRARGRVLRGGGGVSARRGGGAPRRAAVPPAPPSRQSDRALGPHAARRHTLGLDGQRRQAGRAGGRGKAPALRSDGRLAEPWGSRC